jgi:hypothetical protein
LKAASRISELIVRQPAISFPSGRGSLVSTAGSSVPTVGQFTPESQPLGVPADHHRVEIRSNGFRTIGFDVDIIAGEVVPYQGAITGS